MVIKHPLSTGAKWNGSPKICTWRSSYKVWSVRAVLGHDHRAGWTLPGEMALGGPGTHPLLGWGPDSEMRPTPEQRRRARILELTPASESRL